MSDMAAVFDRASNALLLAAAMQERRDSPNNCEAVERQMLIVVSLTSIAQFLTEPGSVIWLLLERETETLELRLGVGSTNPSVATEPS